MSNEHVYRNSFELLWSNIHFQLPEGSVSATDQSLSMTIPSCSVGLAYLWEVTPVLGTAALPMYSKIGAPYGLPGAPWVREVGPLFI